jgi:hypothetical protein
MKTKQPEIVEWEKEYVERVRRWIIGIVGQFGRPMQEMTDLEKVELERQVEQLTRGVLYKAGKTIQSQADKTREDTLKEVGEKIKKYSSMNEVVIKGQRFLQDKDGNKIKFGYPYPDTKEKYIITTLLNQINKLKKK